MKREITQSLVATKLFVAMLWPFSAYAAQLSFGEELSTIPVLSLIMTLILSALMGVTAVLHAMTEEYKTKDKIDRVWLFVSSKMFGSVSAGFMMFFGADSLAIPTGYKALAIAGAAFGGTMLIQRFVKMQADKRMGAE
jgi:hypothetical protein